MSEEEFDPKNFGEKEAKLLQTIAYKGGASDTRELVESTGFNHQQIHYLYEKFEDWEIAEVRTKDHDPTPGLAMKEIKLTKQGRELVDSHQVNQLLEDDKELELQGVVAELRQKVDDLENDVEKYQKSANQKFKDVNKAFQKADDIMENIDEIEGKIPDWSAVTTSYEYDEATEGYECNSCRNWEEFIPMICPDCVRPVRGHDAWRGQFDHD